MSRRIPLGRPEVGRSAGDVGHGEPVIGRPRASRETIAGIDLATLDGQTVPIGVEGERGWGDSTALGCADKSDDRGVLTVSSDNQSRRLIGGARAPPLLQSNSANPIAFSAELDHRASLAYLGPSGAGSVDEHCIETRPSWTDHHADVL